MHIFLLGALVIFGGFYMFDWFNNALFTVTISNGVARCTQGDVPPSLLQQLADAARMGGLREGSIKAWKTEQGLSVRTSPRNEGVEQRLRNTLSARRWMQFRAPANPHLETAKRAVVWTAVATFVSRALRR